MGPSQDGEDQSGASSSGPAPVPDAVEAPRPSEPLSQPALKLEPGHPRGSVFSRWQVQVLIGVLAALLVWPLAARDPGDNSIEATVAGETLERNATTSTTASPTSSTTSVAAGEATTTTTTTVTPAPAVTAPPTTSRPAAPSTTTTSTPTTTTTVPKPPKPIRRQSATQVFPGVQLTLTASAPEPGEARTAVFRLSAEFGDTRVLRAARIDFGEGGSDDLEVFPWACWDAAAPNPYVLSDLSHIYPAGGTYAVTVTVRTASCVPGQNEPGPEATAELPLVLTVP